MIVNAAISNLIREGKTHQIYNAIEVGGRIGMISLDKAIANLVKAGNITYDTGLAKANNPKHFESLAQGLHV